VKQGREPPPTSRASLSEREGSRSPTRPAASRYVRVTAEQPCQEAATAVASAPGGRRPRYRGPVGRVLAGIDERLQAFLEAQPVFFVATAPLDPGGHVNCSPKGNRGEFAVLDAHRVAYLDQHGSGIETAAHLAENARIVLMFCAFSGPPKVVRLHGRGGAHPAGTEVFAELAPWFPDEALELARAVVSVQVTRVSTSCGYGVPLMAFEGHRPELDRWARRKGPDGLAAYRAAENAASVDGLPGLVEPAPARSRR
jgi:hypothetical protein